MPETTTSTQDTDATAFRELRDELNTNGSTDLRDFDALDDLAEGHVTSPTLIEVKDKATGETDIRVVKSVGDAAIHNPMAVSSDHPWHPHEH